MTIARATATLAGGSVVSLIAGALSAKLIAVMAGPVGTGTVGLLSSLLTLGVLVGGFGIATGLIRQVALATASGDALAISSAHQAARLGVLAAASAIALGLIALRDQIATFLFGDGGSELDVVLVGIAVVFTALAGVEAGLVNGLHRVKWVATVTAASAAGMALALVAAVFVGGTGAVAAGLLIGSLVGWIVAMAVALMVVPRVAARIDRQRRGADLRALLRFGGPFTVSQLLGAGAQLAIPFLVLAMLQTADVGYYRAAATISVAYLAFLLNAMAQDYYPRVSAISGTPAIEGTARRQLRFVLMVCIPLILLTSAAAPILVTVLYSGEFAPAVDVLGWQLAGDMLKLPAWTLSFVLLARGASGTFLAVEAIGGFALIVLSVVGLQAVGIAGAGIGYLGAYVIYYIAVSVAARELVPPRFGREELAIAVTCAVLVVAQLARLSLDDMLISIILGVGGILAGVASARWLWAGRHD